MSRVVLSVLVVCLALIACAGETTSTPDAAATQVAALRAAAATLTAEVPTPTPTSPGQDQVGLPQYSILDEKVDDGPLKTQVRQDILVSGQISEAGLRTLLGQLYSGIMARRGFRYSKAPTNVYIYAFTSPERARSGQWIAMLWKHLDDTGPTIDVFEGELSQLGAPDEERFGLSEDERKEIWWEVGLAVKETVEDCERLYPEWDRETLQRFNRCLDRMWDRIIADAAERYDLSVEQLEEIGDEANRECWTVP